MFILYLNSGFDVKLTVPEIYKIPILKWLYLLKIYSLYEIIVFEQQFVHYIWLSDWQHIVKSSASQNISLAGSVKAKS